MYCFAPLQAYAKYNDKGYIDEQLSFYPRKDYEPLEIDCGKCAGCLMKQRAQKMLLLNLDISEHTIYNEKKDVYIEPPQCMLTLTYRPENLTYHGGLNYLDYSLFQKSLKQYLRRNKLDSKLRGVVGGELGPNGTHRPHFHIYFTNFKPDDCRYLWMDFKQFSKGYKREYKTSPTICHFWDKGFITVIDGNKKSRSYVLGYTLKKIQYIDNEYLKKITKWTNARKFKHKNQFESFLKYFEDKLRYYTYEEGLLEDNVLHEFYDVMDHNISKKYFFVPLINYMKDVIDNTSIFNDCDIELFQELTEKYIYVDGRKYLRPSFPCGRCIWDVKQELNLPAEKNRLFGGLGSKYYDIFKNDIVRGYIVDPYTRIKCKIPLKYMTKLKEEDFQKYENIRLLNARRFRESNKEERDKKKEEFMCKMSGKVSQGFNIKARELDFSPLSEEDEEYFDKHIHPF